MSREYDPKSYADRLDVLLGAFDSPVAPNESWRVGLTGVRERLVGCMNPMGRESHYNNGSNNALRQAVAEIDEVLAGTSPGMKSAATLPAAPAPTEQQDELPITRSTYGSLEACEAEQARRNAAPTGQAPGDMPTLPQHLLDVIFEYGWARADCVGEKEIRRRLETLIAGIKNYAWAALAARQTDPAAAAIRITNKQQADPKLAGPGATARERFLLAQLGWLQSAVLAARPAPTEQDPGEPYMFKLPGDHDWQLGFAPLPEGAYRLKLLIGAPDAGREAKLIDAFLRKEQAQ